MSRTFHSFGYTIAAFSDVRQRLGKNGRNMFVPDAVIDDFTGPPERHQFQLPKHFQVMRNGRCAHLKQRADVADTHFRCQQGMDDFEPRRVRGI